MNSVVLIGAANPEFPALLRRLAETWQLGGLVDDDESLWQQERFGTTVLGGVPWLKEALTDEGGESRLPPGSWVHNSIGSVSARRTINECIAPGLEGRFATLIHPSVSLDSVELGIGVAVFEGATISPEVRVGDHTILSFNTVVAHESTVGEYCTITPGAIINGRCTIGNDVHIGSGAVILPDVTIEPGATVGAGSVVTRDVAAGRTVFGNPARLLV